MRPLKDEQSSRIRNGGFFPGGGADGIGAEHYRMDGGLPHTSHAFMADPYDPYIPSMLTRIAYYW
ncbi:hypothetical protein GCM10022224_031660 [Nonomuraea antimicrobica]|uniref:Uncharacterized protein n=1 Tax=Nonomuraea antimicrobica TaxID=561173 RepID=A0ABP7BMG2_9ACTN